MQSQNQSQTQTAVVLLSDYTFIYNELQNALNENTKLKNSLKQQEAIVVNQQQIIQRYQMMIFQQQTSSMNRPSQSQPQSQSQPTFGFTSTPVQAPVSQPTFGFTSPPVQTPVPQNKPVIDLTLENAGMCFVNRSLFNPPSFSVVPPTPVESISTSSTIGGKSNKRPKEKDGDETETDDELVARKPKKYSNTSVQKNSEVSNPSSMGGPNRDRLQKILLDINSENSEVEEELLFHNKTSVSVPLKNELENMSFNSAKKAFLNKKPVKVNFSFVAESELIDKIWYLNINGHRFLRINDDFRDTNITKFMNNEVEITDDLKIVDGVDLIEVKCINNKWKQGITYSGMIKLLWYLANNHPQTCDKLLAKFASTLEKIVYSCEK